MAKTVADPRVLKATSQPNMLANLQVMISQSSNYLIN